MLWELREKTELRPEEAYGLHVGDIDLSANKIRIERAVSLGRMKDTKTHERRYIDLSDGLVSLLTEVDERWHRDLCKQVVSAVQPPVFV